MKLGDTPVSPRTPWDSVIRGSTFLLRHSLLLRTMMDTMGRRQRRVKLSFCRNRKRTTQRM